MIAPSFLIDTHIFIWWTERNARLSKHVAHILADLGNKIYVSSAVPWEIAVKSARGRIGVPTDLDDIMEEEGFTPLFISHAHALRIAELPPIHRDPFDRIQLAQAKHEGLTFITADKVNLSYPHIAMLEG